ncbi:FMN-binding negative transcriptional regulator [Spongiivirga citrea]|uniref:FMN-binding negative transcriptional regulator n=1 Tax=Spongiivirga citrea TaxID=1481457 RepID=A0A6M0CEJ8_9FLAO|nr:FMN-binding negative transcriptional regulator [Spongiivirga citrea]NER16245.1 FMN-binding negative transcriptional regulator [Spongiivirga citrea]
MYTPKYYKNEDLDEILAFLKANSFGILVSKTEKLLATHIPIELIQKEDKKWYLQGHVAKGNPQWNDFKNEEVLAIFNGPHSYVSSSWYDFEEVPTWNYIAVHVYGKIRTTTEDELLTMLHALVDKYEADSKDPIKLENLSPKTIRQIRGIVGFEIEITDIQATYKLSQSHSDHNYHNVVDELAKVPNEGSKEIAQIMKKKRSK